MSQQEEKKKRVKEQKGECKKKKRNRTHQEVMKDVSFRLRQQLSRQCQRDDTERRMHVDEQRTTRRRLSSMREQTMMLRFSFAGCLAKAAVVASCGGLKREWAKLV